jgi:hypothetical protein
MTSPFYIALPALIISLLALAPGSAAPAALEEKDIFVAGEDG